ncbi:aldo/keto reductase [Methanoplanus endosymbiosus]|uniref:Aldo/keto reductase n=1 Tax=Methanoplanus endosymbiosus TaxID=33865 RepID=A0A9E7PMN4_9EURY|nr:aldo/keto reductase [Methanoplanus endosymbiosus]UUX93038.1 aldo/keto reductase [Methanoplanus endosymbiosus]
MQHRIIPKTGDKLPVLGFGAMRFPETAGRIDRAKASEMLAYAIENGVNYIDTAVPYHKGQSESFIGDFLEKEGLRDKVFIATKLPHWSVRNPDDISRIFEKQLKDLKTGYIDYYLLHSLSGESWHNLDDLGIKKFLDLEKASGRIRNAGFSFHGDIESFKDVVNAYPWEFCQIQYNFLDEKNQAGTEGLKYAAKSGLAVMVMEPLRGGNLAGNIPENIMDIWKSAKVHRTPAEWALRWVWNHPEVTTVLSGMSSIDQVKENIRVAEDAFPASLSEDELIVIGKVRDKYKETMKVGCTGCRYCMPCPAGVDIPSCFEYYNSYHMFKNGNWAKWQYVFRSHGIMDGKKSHASLCTGCGRCKKACPQHIDIPLRLKEVAKDFDTPVTKAFSGIAGFYLTLRGKISEVLKIKKKVR